MSLWCAAGFALIFFFFLYLQIKHVVLQMAGYVSPDLREWVETNTTFPNTMVDRITPMTEAEHIELVARYGGIAMMAVGDDGKGWMHYYICTVWR